MNRTLPWYVQPPYNGCNDERMQYSVWDADGNVVCECDGDGEGRAEAVAIATAVNRAGPKLCANCGEPATCFGSYETDLTPAYACDTCCAHGNEDGRCERVFEELDADERKAISDFDQALERLAIEQFTVEVSTDGVVLHSNDRTLEIVTRKGGVVASTRQAILAAFRAMQHLLMQRRQEKSHESHD